MAAFEALQPGKRLRRSLLLGKDLELPAVEQQKKRSIYDRYKESRGLNSRRLAHQGQSASPESRSALEMLWDLFGERYRQAFNFIQRPSVGASNAGR